MKKISTILISLTLVSSLNAQLLFKKQQANLSEATNNAKHIGLAFFEFDSNYGNLPSDATKAQVEEDSGLTLPENDKSSDNLFRQLFAAGIIENEKFFYANITGAKKGDQADAVKALGQGKNAFAFIAGLSTSGNTARPILICPLIPGTKKFDPKPFGGKALLLRMDQSVTTHNIEDNGSVMIDGKELDIRYPDIPKDAK